VFSVPGRMAISLAFEGTASAASVGNSEIVKLYTEGLGERKTIESYILSEGQEGRLFMLCNRNTYPWQKRNPR